MPNLVILYDRELKYNAMQTIVNISKGLPRGWKVHMVSLYKEKPALDFDFEFTYLFGHPVFSKKMSDSEIEDAEKWLGYPFPLLLRSNPFFNQEWGKERYPEFLAQLTYFWKEFLAKKKIDATLTILESAYTHLVGLEACKRMNIKTVFLAVSRLGGGIVFLDGSFHPIYFKELTKKQMLAGYEKTRDLIRNSSKPMKMEIRKWRGNFRFPDLMLHGKRALDYLTKWPECQKLTYPSPYTLAVRRARREMRRITIPLLYKKAPLDSKFFLFPISFTDEAYNSYFNGVFDQYDIIKSVSRMLPSGYWLYVKPHPHFCGNDIPIAEAREISRLPNVRFISHNAPFKQLLERCAGVITVSATTGFEAMLYGKPVVVFGKPFYAEEGTVIMARDPMQLPYTLLKITEDAGYGIDEEKRKQLCGKYYAHQIPLATKPFNNKHLIVTGDEAKKAADSFVSSYEYLLRNGPSKREERAVVKS